MQAIADMIAGVLVEGRDPEHVRAEAIELRAGHQTHPLLLHRITSSADGGGHRARPRDAQARRAARAVAGHQHRPPRQPRPREPLRREGRRPPGLQRVDGEPDDRAVLRRAGGAGPRQRQAAREPGPARDQPPARPARPPLPDDAARVRRAAVLPEPDEGPRPGRLLDRQRRPRRHRADLGRARAPLRRGPLRRPARRPPDRADRRRRARRGRLLGGDRGPDGQPPRRGHVGRRPQPPVAGPRRPRHRRRPARRDVRGRRLAHGDGQVRPAAATSAPT